MISTIVIHLLRTNIVLAAAVPRYLAVFLSSEFSIRIFQFMNTFDALGNQNNFFSKNREGNYIRTGDKMCSWDKNVFCEFITYRA